MPNIKDTAAKSTAANSKPNAGYSPRGVLTPMATKAGVYSEKVGGQTEDEPRKVIVFQYDLNDLEADRIRLQKNQVLLKSLRDELRVHRIANLLRSGIQRTDAEAMCREQIGDSIGY